MKETQHFMTWKLHRATCSCGNWTRDLEYIEALAAHTEHVKDIQAFKEKIKTIFIDRVIH